MAVGKRQQVARLPKRWTNWVAQVIRKVNIADVTGNLSSAADLLFVWRPITYKHISVNCGEQGVRIAVSSIVVAYVRLFETPLRITIGLGIYQDFQWIDAIDKWSK